MPRVGIFERRPADIFVARRLVESAVRENFHLPGVEDFPDFNQSGVRIARYGKRPAVDERLRFRNVARSTESLLFGFPAIGDAEFFQVEKIDFRAAFGRELGEGGFVAQLAQFGGVYARGSAEHRIAGALYQNFAVARSPHLEYCCLREFVRSVREFECDFSATAGFFGKLHRGFERRERFLLRAVRGRVVAVGREID